MFLVIFLSFFFFFFFVSIFACQLDIVGIWAPEVRSTDRVARGTAERRRDQEGRVSKLLITYRVSLLDVLACTITSTPYATRRHARFFFSIFLFFFLSIYSLCSLFVLASFFVCWTAPEPRSNWTERETGSKREGDEMTIVLSKQMANFFASTPRSVIRTGVP